MPGLEEFKLNAQGEQIDVGFTRSRCPRCIKLVTCVLESLPFHAQGDLFGEVIFRSDTVSQVRSRGATGRSSARPCAANLAALSIYVPEKSAQLAEYGKTVTHRQCAHTSDAPALRFSLAGVFPAGPVAVVLVEVLPKST